MDDDSITIRLESNAGGRARLAVAGEIDAVTAPVLAARLAEVSVEGIAEVVLDFGKLEFIDSSGLSVLVVAHRRLRDAGAALVIEAPPPTARRVFAIAGLDRILTIR